LPSALERLLARAVSLLEGSGFEYMVIGGFALPSFGPVRTTVDVDLAVKVDSAKESERLVARASAENFMPGVASYSNPVCVLLDKKTGLEVELWLRPDGVEWDRETLRKRRRVRTGGVKAWVISPEDFIVSKLARPDRGVQDEKDVAGVLARLGVFLDRSYLNKRARRAGVLPVLEAISRAVSKE
jgi:predicted nucleotidyltransferase